MGWSRSAEQPRKRERGHPSDYSKGIQAQRSLRVTHARSTDASRVGPIIRVDGDHLLRTTLNLARIRHGGRGSCTGSICRVGERVAASGGRAPIRVVLVVLVRNVIFSRVGGGGGGSCGAWACVGGGVGFGCVRWVIDAIVDGTEDGAWVRLAVVDSAVWVCLGRGGVDAEVCRARTERALSELARKVGLVGGGGRSAGILLVKVVFVVAGPAISLYHRDSTYDNSKPADDTDDTESSTDSSFVREKALGGGGANGGRGINGRTRNGGQNVTATRHG